MRRTKGRRAWRNPCDEGVAMPGMPCMHSAFPASSTVQLRLGPSTQVRPNGVPRFRRCDAGDGPNRRTATRTPSPPAHVPTMPCKAASVPSCSSCHVAHGITSTTYASFRHVSRYVSLGSFLFHPIGSLQSSLSNRGSKGTNPSEPATLLLPSRLSSSSPSGRRGV